MPDYNFIDTHAHLDGEEFNDDLPLVIERAKESGVCAIFALGVDASSVASVMDVCRQYPGYCYPMIGLQPEEVRGDWRDVLAMMHKALDDNAAIASGQPRYIAIGECGLDFYWSREFEKEQLEAFEEQVRWSVETHAADDPLPKGSKRAPAYLEKLRERPYGGVFHCFTGNQKEAEEFLRFDKFVLGIGGVSTFKSSHLREDLPAVAPLSRIVLETDSPYMAPVPNRGKRNESAFVSLVLENLAKCYATSAEEVARITNENVHRTFPCINDKRALNCGSRKHI